MIVNTNSVLAQLVTEYPASSRVLLRHGLDFCCGGQQTLVAACEGAKLGVDDVIAEMNELTVDDAAVRWDTAPIPDLIDHILETYHAPLPEEFAQLQSMTDKVLRVHGEKDPERLGGLAKAVRFLADDLSVHMKKEELVLFPWILNGRQPKPVAPISAMRHEHEEAGAALEELRTLTDNFTPPNGACMTWRTLYARLERFDSDLRHHIHLENNILFPRVLA